MFVSGTALSAAGIVMSDRLFGFTSGSESVSNSGSESLERNFNIMQEVFKYRKIDSHVHVNLSSTDPEVQKKYAEELMNYSKRLKVEKLILSNPVHPIESMDEIKRCVDLGMVNAKVYYQTKINDPS